LNSNEITECYNKTQPEKKAGWFSGFRLSFTRKKIVRILVILALLTLVFSYLVNHHIDNAYNNRIYSDVNVIPHNRVALLLGTARTFNGRLNLYFLTRVNAVADLYHANKIDKIIASGDNSRKGYDEATDMQQALIQKGVKPADIYLDYAGFRTLDSVVRLKKVFKINKVTIISQKTHCQRALFIANNNGIDAIAYTAQDVNHIGKIRLQIREYLARVKAWLDIFILNKSPKFLGKPVVIR